jgi:preprotein translocase subunit SecG
MNLIESATLVLHVLTAMTVCGFVLLQHGKGADMGAAFGSGSSGSLFGAAGSANFLSRTTALLATVFFVTSIALTYFGSKHGVPQGIMEKPGVMEQVVPTKPGDVPQAAPSTNAAPAPAPSGPASPAPGTAPADVPK